MEKTFGGFEELYAADYQRVFAATFAFCGNREVAQDATQEAFSRALARWRRIRKEPWITGWVLVTAMNAARRSISRGMRESPRETVPERVPAPGPAPDELDLVSELRQLPPRQREAAFLYYLGDQSVATVANLMGLSEGAVKAHLSRARERLRAASSSYSQLESSGGGRS